MTLRKITIDNNVKFIAENEQTRESKPNTTKNNSVSRKQEKNVSQNNKKLLNHKSEPGFKYVTK